MYGAIIDSVCKDKLVTDALLLYSEMTVKKIIYPDIVTYSTIIYGLFIVGQMKEGVALLNEMSLKNISPNVLTFTTLVDGLCKEGEVKKATSVLPVMNYDKTRCGT